MWGAGFSLTPQGSLAQVEFDSTICYKRKEKKIWSYFDWAPPILLDSTESIMHSEERSPPKCPLPWPSCFSAFSSSQSSGTAEIKSPPHFSSWVYRASLVEISNSAMPASWFVNMEIQQIFYLPSTKSFSINTVLLQNVILDIRFWSNTCFCFHSCYKHLSLPTYTGTCMHTHTHTHTHHTHTHTQKMHDMNCLKRLSDAKKYTKDRHICICIFWIVVAATWSFPSSL